MNGFSLASTAEPSSWTRWPRYGPDWSFPFAIPLVSRIHEGVVFSNRDKRTLPKKMTILLEGLYILEPCYFIADAYYACKTTIRELLKSGKDHLISRVRNNAVAYLPAKNPKHTRRGAPRNLFLPFLDDSHDSFATFLRKPAPPS